MSYIINRLTEASTWAGIGLVITQAAQAWATKDPQAIAAVLGGLLAVLTKEKGAGHA